MKREEILAALANPVRVKLLNCLGKAPKSVEEMIQVCGLAQSAVSQHLERLRSAGLVYTKKEGRFVYYYIKNENVAKISNQLEEFCTKEENESHIFQEIKAIA